MRGLLKAVLALLLLAGIGGMVWFMFPPAQELTNRSLTQRAATQLAAEGAWPEVADKLSPLVAQNPTEIDSNLLYAKALTKEEENLSEKDQPVQESGPADTADMENANNDSNKAQIHSVQASSEALAVYSRLWKTHTGNVSVGTAYAAYLANKPATRPLGLSILRELLAAHPKNAKVLLALGEVYQKAASQKHPQPYALPMTVWLNRWSAYYTQAGIPLIKPIQEQFTPRVHIGQLHQKLAQQDSKNTHHHLVQAARQYCNALLLYPKHASTRFNLGTTLMNLNATEEGVSQMNGAIQLLMGENRVGKAQKLSEEAQRIKTSLFYSDPKGRVTPNDVDDLLGRCLADPRLKLNDTKVS